MDHYSWYGERENTRELGAIECVCKRHEGCLRMDIEPMS